MATYYIDSSATAGAGDGSTKADAYLDIKLAIEDASTALGDLFYVSHTHAASTVGNYLIGATFSYVAMRGLTFISVDFSGATPPDETDYLRGASEATTSSGQLAFAASNDFINFTFRGFDFDGDGSIYTAEDSSYWFEDCKFTSGDSTYLIHVRATAPTHFQDCEFNITNANQYIAGRSGSMIEVVNCVWTGTAPTKWVFGHWSSGAGYVWGHGLDLSNIATTCDIFETLSTISYGSCRGYLSGCLMPTSWSGDIVEDAVNNRWERYEVHIVDDADTAIESRVAGCGGSIVTDTSTYHTAAYSMKMTGLASAPSQAATFPLELEIGELYVEAATTTLEVRFTSSVALTNQNFWVLVQSPDSTTYPLQVFGESRVYGDTVPDGTGSAHTTHATGWTSGQTFQYKYTHTIATSQAGMHRVFCFLASTTNSHVVYVDPFITAA